MESLHPRLRRQLDQIGWTDLSRPPDPSKLRGLLNLVSGSYVGLDAARQSNRARDEFFAGLGDKVRGPMNGVVGMVDLLVHSELSPEQRECAETVRESGRELLGILNDVVDYARIEAGSLEIEPIPFDLRRAIEDVVEGHAALAERKQLELIVRYDPRCPRQVIGDAGRIRQIVATLLGNAIEFTSEGHILVDVEAVTTTPGEARIRIAIEDTCVGLPERRLAQAFAGLQERSDDYAPFFPKNGLGLAIARELVELMGGSIGLSVHRDRGATFSIELPLPVQQEASAHLPAEDLRGVRTMVVDSSSARRRMLDEQLRHWGARSESFATGGEALRELRESHGEGDPFRIVLLSHQLPGMDAATFGDLVKSDPKLRESDLVLLAPFGEKGDARRLRDIGFAGYLVKPVREAALRETLEVVWGSRKHGAEPGLVTKHTLTDSRIEKRPLRVT